MLDLEQYQSKPDFSLQQETFLITYWLDNPDDFTKATRYLKPGPFKGKLSKLIIAEMLNLHEKHGKPMPRKLVLDSILSQFTIDELTEIGLDASDIEKAVTRVNTADESSYAKENQRTWMQRRILDTIYEQGMIRLRAADDTQYLDQLGEIVNEYHRVARPITPDDRFVPWKELRNENLTTNWLVDRLIAKDQPLIVGGPEKALKTSITLDAAVSIASGTKFLNEYETTQGNVAFVSGESGKQTVRDLVATICREREIDPDVLNDRLFLRFSLPTLGTKGTLLAMRQEIEPCKPALLVIDPLYLALRGDGKLQTTNMFEMGPLFLEINDFARSIGATLCLVHHFRGTKGFGKPNLTDLAFPGAKQFARQWLLLTRRERYDASGVHRLWFHAGGAGRAVDWSLDIDEGLHGNPSWKATLGVATAEADATGDKDAASGAELLVALGSLEQKDKPVSQRQLQDATKWNNNKLLRVLLNLCEEGSIEKYNEGERPYYRLPTNVKNVTAKIATEDQKEASGKQHE